MNSDKIDLTGIGGISNNSSSEEDTYSSSDFKETEFVDEPTSLDIDKGFEKDDNTSINITIQNKEVPIILLFGPASCGKSMTLVRLSRYIYKKGYTVDTVSNFRTGNKYIETCANFKKNLDTETPVPGTMREEFLLLEVRKKGNLICYFLEAPGEHYFPKERNDFNYIPPYMSQIINKLPNQKIWVYIMEAGWTEDGILHKKYVERIQLFRNKFKGPKDRHILLHNKIDRKNTLFVSGRLNTTAAQKDLFEEYSTLSALFKNNNIITSLFIPYRFTYVPFSTGEYIENEDKTKIYYTESKDDYPYLLWKEILKCKQGRGYE